MIIMEIFLHFNVFMTIKDLHLNFDVLIIISKLTIRGLMFELELFIIIKLVMSEFVN